MEPLVKLSGIIKQFPNVIALKEVDFSLLEGEVHSLVGENGAGKSTLMNVLYGVIQPDMGDIFIRGEKQIINSARDAMSFGIGMVHQEFMLAPTMTVLENIILGFEPNNRSVLDYDHAFNKITELSREYGLAVRPDSKIMDNSVGEAQRVEILKALYRGAEVLILDEPTAVLTPQETDDLFKVIDTLKQHGKTVIFISHKLQEVMEISDRITVMRDGKVQGTLDVADATKEKLAMLMVGREVFLNIKAPSTKTGPVVLNVQGVSAKGRRKLSELTDISFQVHAGEILGIAGVDGNGQSELVEVLTGLSKIEQGEITILGTPIANLSPGEIRKRRVAHIPEDRNTSGLCKEMTVGENLIATTLDNPPLSKHRVIKFQEVNTLASKLVKEYDIRPANHRIRTENLSGGNKQKVIVAREVSEDADLLIAAHPTRGVDIGSIEFIRSILLSQREQGKAILLVSADLEEIMSLSDRIAVMYEGKIVGILPATDGNERVLGLMMAGGGYDETAKRKEDEVVEA
ncbi:MAG TPA: ABC transporter ATP-binding protein [Firmicutes bacterium]|jgi:simple sugar transport system ATP-binding protein|nr:ABC transporter ATP-binding protein [Bacillota bacterium]